MPALHFLKCGKWTGRAHKDSPCIPGVRADTLNLIPGDRGEIFPMLPAEFWGQTPSTCHNLGSMNKWHHHSGLFGIIQLTEDAYFVQQVQTIMTNADIRVWLVTWLPERKVKESFYAFNQGATVDAWLLTSKTVMAECEIHNLSCSILPHSQRNQVSSFICVLNFQKWKWFYTAECLACIISDKWKFLINR